jgi:hypothetical protein
MTSLDTSTGAVETGPVSYVQWGSIFAGAITASAVSFVLMTFGSAVGLALVSPWEMGRNPTTLLMIISAIWFVTVTVGSFALGGYLAGRLRARLTTTSTPDEVEFRDGAHGLAVWAAGVLLGAVIAYLTATAAATGAASAIGGAASSATEAATTVASDRLLRGNPTAPAAPMDENMRNEVSRMLASGELEAADRTYLAQTIAARAGIPQPEAEKRIDEAVNAVKSAADTARITTILLAFTLAASLVISAAAAWFAAHAGGRHRDMGTAPSLAWRRM